MAIVQFLIDSNCLDTSNVMLVRHACTDAVVCHTKRPVSHPILQTLGVSHDSVSNGSNVDQAWIAVLLTKLVGSILSNGLAEGLAQSKTGQMTMRHLTSKFGCGGRI